MKPYSLTMAATVLSLVFISCDTPGIRLVDPDVPSDLSSGVTFQVHLENSVLAEALDWSNGVPGAAVFIQRVAEPFAPESLTTDSSGRVFVPDFLPGQYKIAAHRVLDQDETGPTGGVVRAFGDGWILNVKRGAVVRMRLMADHAGSLVFSELWDGAVPGAAGSGYMFAHYVELYNNSDTTVYLDGMLLGRGWGVVGEITDLSCAASEPMRNDPLGIWSTQMHMFPGSGRDYPVAPGEAVTVARDAVDHSVVHPKLPDLSDADFEFEGVADADNPDVPNMPHLGPTADASGHGMAFRSTMFLALPTEFESLDRRRNIRGNEQARVPTDLLLDVVRLVNGENYTIQQIIRPCGLVAPRSLERLEGGEFFEYWDDFSLAIHRRILRTNAAGRFVLQDVNTSFVDFVPGPRNPGVVEW